MDTMLSRRPRGVKECSDEERHFFAQ